ncbi:DUF982 domain-containing protein [Aliirhizobium terrae]|uniref:DUF982 domain-containing protein n=1 Tax=Terrirhizobium terrae TaxID=2926709 RepID=UPI002576C403|nr:DUF982 domain-containing protein [Rhizobium sp. CC-CFT758]WJH40621.1 DUF982 domain-containing protein [Rhizobium sp. CC-CFT758]
MGAVIRIGFTLHWKKPVHVGTEDRLDVTIRGPGDAIRYMHANFVAKRGSSYWRAHSLCHHAISGQMHHELSRQAFLDAWVEQTFIVEGASD